MSLKTIFIGWGKKFGFLPTSRAEEKLSKLRMSICDRCRESKTSKVLVILNGEANRVDSLFCNKCLCPCLEKSLVVEEHCPIHKW